MQLDIDLSPPAIDYNTTFSYTISVLAQMNS